MSNPIPKGNDAPEVNVDESTNVPKRANSNDGPLPIPTRGEVKLEGSVPQQKRARAQEDDEIVIDHFRPTPCVERGTEVSIYGSGFGRRQAGRYVVLGGHGISAVLRVGDWREGRISARVENYRRIERGQWYYIGIQNEDHQWISNISRTITICRGLE